jgi:hypothetical protein
MYTMLEDMDLERLERVSNITGVDYEITGKFVPVDNIVCALLDLLCEYNNKVDELEELKDEINECYTPKHADPYEEYGVSRNDFV